MATKNTPAASAVANPLRGAVLTVLFCAAFLSLCYAAADHTAEAYAERHEHRRIIIPSQERVGTSLLSFVRRIPDGRGNYRAAALDADQLRQVLATGRIRYVIRLNGDGPNDRGPLSCAEERALVEAAGAVYVTSPSTPDRFDAHAGYREGRGYLGALQQAVGYFRRGGVLIHCRHGHDRTGALVGGWLAGLDLPQKHIIRYNRWAGYEKKGAAYGRYLETVLGQVVGEGAK